MNRDVEESKCLFGCKFYYANLHMFPHPVREPELFAQWLQATRHIITETEPEIIYKKYKVCHEHFPSDMKYRQFILRTAVPCLNLKDKNTSKKKTKGLGVTEVEQAKSTILAAAPAKDIIFEAVSTQDNILEVPIIDNYGAESGNNTLNADHDYVMMYEDDIDDIFRVDKKTEETTRSEAFHEGYSCNLCEESIQGYRYTCVQCRDFDLCSRCEDKGLHNSHYVLRIPEPRVNDDIENLLSVIRRELFGEITSSRVSTPSNHFDPVLDNEEEELFMYPTASDKASIENQAQHKLDDIQDFEPEKQKNATTNQTYTNKKSILPNIIKKRNVTEQQKGNFKIGIENMSLHRKFRENLSFQSLSDPRTAGGDHLIFRDSGQFKNGAERQNENVNLHSASKFIPRWPPKTEVINKESNQEKARPKIIICKSKLARKAKLKKVRVVLTRLTQDEIDAAVNKTKRK